MLFRAPASNMVTTILFFMLFHLRIDEFKTFWSCFVKGASWEIFLIDITAINLNVVSLHIQLVKPHNSISVAVPELCFIC